MPIWQPSFSPLVARPWACSPRLTKGPNLLVSVLTYVRLAPGASIDQLQREMPAFVERHYPRAARESTIAGLEARYTFTPIDRIHFSPPDFRVTKPRGNIETVYA